MMDLTTLEGKILRGKLRSLSKAMQPADRVSQGFPPARRCVFIQFMFACEEVSGDSRVKVASVATAFPRLDAAIN